MEWKMTLLNEREKGREEGVLSEQIDTITKKIRKGRSLEEAAGEMEKDQEVIRPIWEVVKAHAPEYNREKILQTLLARKEDAQANPGKMTMGS